MSIAIQAENVGKQYKRYQTDRSRTLQEAFTRRFRGQFAVEKIWALQDVSFSVAQGEMLGVIGANGAGKSTLLRLLGGVGRPDRGNITVVGRIGGLLDLGAGFHPDLTGRENLFINGIISGLTRQEVSERFDTIVAFAELEEAIDSPLRTYSSGMRMRLGFSVAAYTDPEILLIDEVLAVGDVAFRKKCFQRIQEFRSAGKTIVFVTHDTYQVENFCDKAIWLKAGRLFIAGDPAMVVNSYITEMNRYGVFQVAKPSKKSKLIRASSEQSSKSEAAITQVRLLNKKGQVISSLTTGDGMRLEIDFLASQELTAPIFSVTICDEENKICCRLNSAGDALTIPTLLGKGKVVLDIANLDLVSGDYQVRAGIFAGDWQQTYDYRHEATFFSVVSKGRKNDGILMPPHQWSIEAQHEPLQMLQR